MTAELVWFRRDVRLSDNPAWTAATRFDQVVALFVIGRVLVLLGDNAEQIEQDQLDG